jgi:hypothetical protein
MYWTILSIHHSLLHHSIRIDRKERRACRTPSPLTYTRMREQQQDTATAGPRRRRPLLVVGGLVAAAIVAGQQADCVMAAAVAGGAEGRRQCGFLPALGGGGIGSSRLMGT